ncbi:MAG: peptidase C15 [Cyanobacteria bacterium P01_B01_bin.77]
MAAPILITSFRPWKANQELNSSDILLARVMAKLPSHAIFLRYLPVNFDLAPIRVINHIVQYRPKVVVCCGMAETRKTLTVEQWGTHQEQRLATPINLQTLVDSTIHAAISKDAGNFVCNRLYYRILHYLNQYSQPPCQPAALFVHVPPITPINQALIEFDFLKIIEQLDTEW